MAVKGIGAYFAIDGASSPTLLTNVSGYLDAINGTSDVERLDTTVFQPDVAAPLKTELAGGRTRNFSLTGKWTAAAEAFFAALEGSEGLNYVYGPQGSTNGLTKIYGLCNCLSYSGPQSTVSGITTFTVELNVTSRTATTFSA